MGLWTKVKGVFGRIGRGALKVAKGVGNVAKTIVDAAGAPIGAAIGSIVPGVGTAIGGAIGGAAQKFANMF